MTRSRFAAAGLTAVTAVLIAAPPLRAQTPPEPGELPPVVAQGAIAFYNRPETVRLSGDTWIGAEAEVAGDVAVLGGTLTLGGSVRGHVFVINGDARLRPGARVAGDLTVVGGAITGLEFATVGGEVSAHRQPLRYRRENGSLSYAPERADRSLTAGRDFVFGRMDLTMSVLRGYNRVEGLPVAAGPRYFGGGSNPVQAEAFVVYRTESGFRIDPDELGYLVRVEHFLGGRRAARVGVQSRSEVVPIEAWGLSDRENSLATFLLHRDFRDYYERAGWSAYARLAPPGSPYDATLEYRADRHETVPARGPWALVGNDREWRPQPLVAEGRLRSIVAGLRYDTRNDPRYPYTGWMVDAEFETGVGGRLSIPFALDAATGEAVGPLPVRYDFTAGIVNVRRYFRVGPGSRIALRGLAAGSLDGGALPPQRQRALGGEGSVPAFKPFAFDCGARDRVAEVAGDRFFPFYGCDRLTLVQFEYQSAISWGRGLVRRAGLDLDVGDTPAWVLFFDTGRAWTEPGARGDGRDEGLADIVAGAGLGLRLGPIGVYWAVPLTGRGRHVNFFVRTGPRF